MHKLARQIRFSINPFLNDVVQGANSYSSKPAGDGLALYFSLWVELVAPADSQTGFVINVVDIDKAVRQTVVPLFDKNISESFAQAKHVTLFDLQCLLGQSWGLVKDEFGDAVISNITLELNPFRKIKITSEDRKVLTISEKFEFAATHKLWNEKFSKDKNFEVFGKCANPNGHGHNYIVEITVDCQDSQLIDMGDFQAGVNREFISIVDHKNLNVDISDFGGKVTTVENITTYAWKRLEGKLGSAKLKSITIWESDRMYCTYSGPSV